MYDFALVGCGAVSEAHIAALNKAGRLVAVCDIDKARADRMCETYGVPAWYSFDTMLAEATFSVLSICTPNGIHAEQVIKALQAQKNVACEAPFCLTKAGAWQIIETEKFCGKTVRVLNRSKYHPFCKATKEADEYQRFSLDISLPEDHPSLKDWRKSVFPGGGILFTTGYPFMEFLVELFGVPLSVSGYAEHTDWPETGTVSLKMEKGFGTIGWSIGSTEEMHLDLFGAKGKQVITLDDLNYNESEILDQFYGDLINQPGLDKFIQGSPEGRFVTEAIDSIYRSISFNSSLS
jgi:UDP-N-acetyl-2-amino-2-deoxyglucuronate dehydrogenase